MVMPVTPRQMARRKAEFREGQANYNRLVQLHGNLKKHFQEYNKLEKEYANMEGNLLRARLGTTQVYNSPAQTHRMMMMWIARERKLEQKRQQKERELNRKANTMMPIIRTYYTLRYGLPHNAETNNDLWHNIYRNTAGGMFSPKRLARLKLARLVNKAAVRPGGWVYKRMFKEGN